MGGKRGPERPAAVLSDQSARKIIDFSADIACVIGFDGQLKQLDTSWQRELGHALDAVVSTPFLDLVHPDDREETTRRMTMLTSGPADTIEIENRVRRHDGTYRTLRWHVNVERAEGLLYCLAQDATDSTIGEAAPNSEARYRFMFDTTDAIAVTDADEVLTFVSPACMPLLGYAPEELIGKPIASLIHPEDRALAGIAGKRAAGTADTQSISLRYRRKDGSYAWIESRSKSIIDPVTGAMRETQAIMHDIGERREAQLAIERQALSDALTGLANRTLLTDRLNQAFRHLKRSPGLVGVLMLDLDHFKVINDTLGHQIGDEVLIAAAARLQHLGRPDDTVARFGGDEFVVVVQGLRQLGDLSAFADRVVAGMREPYQVGKEEVVATVSIGIAVTSQPDHLPDDLLREADLALYRAKDRGRDRHEVYGEALQVRAMQRLETESLLRRAISQGRLAVEYQPVVDLATGITVEAEALLRVDDTDLGRLTPEHFLSVADEAGLLPAMDEWMRATALAQLAAWRSNRLLSGIGSVALNLTARELASADFVLKLGAALRASGLDGRDLAVEVTEHVLLQTSKSAVNSLEELRDLGVRIGLDDFGTGFSALSYLQTFPLDFLKIDRSLVDRIATDERSSHIVAATIELAHAHDLAVVAEGIETREQLASLRGFGCDRGQGYVFARPLMATDFEEHLKAQPPRHSRNADAALMPVTSPALATQAGRSHQGGGDR